jgi:hypothetical protein
MMDATHGAAVVVDLFGIRVVAPTSRCPNVIVVVVVVIKPVPPHNVVEILLDEVAQPPQVVVLPLDIRGRWVAANFLEQCHGLGTAGLQRYFSIAKKYLATESSAVASSMSFRPLSGFHRLINLSIPSKHNASE